MVLSITLCKLKLHSKFDDILEASNIEHKLELQLQLGLNYHRSYVGMTTQTKNISSATCFGQKRTYDICIGISIEQFTE